MSGATEKMQPQKRGRPATGKGTPVQVRLQPELLEILDKLAAEIGSTRPEALRYVFSHWAESYGYIKQPDRLPERPVMLSMSKKVLSQLDELSGGKPYDEVIALAVGEWIEHVKREEAAD
ncbi:CopG family transcriptional regulator [Sinorhizobium meliloti]|jgi:hypothetical protein|uniref:ribbon-helix-helix domain-containing protein n=1 Tax=Rhizobium meliloti TaxID=382 RepID=UPI001F18FD9A|nr:CopG family transcriptional regulator [Sinorhizobium meliloti]